ncbi:MAG: hypothetical protein IKZ12_01955 [Alistipes sp.]|nr:hypothetical protein [Alistipes sp.]
MKYFLRSVKYFCAMCVLCVALMALMILTGTSAMNAEDTLYLMFHSDRFVMLGGALVVLAATYPLFGFVVRRVEGDLTRHREQVEQAFRVAGFALVGEENGTLIFRGEGLGKRLMLLFEDEIRVYQEGDQIAIDGIRRGVAVVAYRLDSYIQMVKYDEK